MAQMPVVDNRAPVIKSRARPSGDENVSRFIPRYPRRIKMADPKPTSAKRKRPMALATRTSLSRPATPSTSRSNDTDDRTILVLSGVSEAGEEGPRGAPPAMAMTISFACSFKAFTLPTRPH